MINTEFMILGIAVILLAGVIASKIARKLHVPDVTGYLIAGLLIGPGLLTMFSDKMTGLISEELVNALKVIVSMELGFIAFNIGSEFKKEYVKKVGMKPIILAIFESLFAIILIFGGVMCFSGILMEKLNCSMTDVVTLGLALGAIGSATAPAATMMVIKQYKARGKVTDTLMAVVAIDDATALIFFGLSVAIIQIISGTGDNVALQIIKPFLEILASIGLGLVLGIILSLLLKYFKGRNNRTIISIALVFLSVGLVELLNHTYNINISDLFTTMVMGVIFTNISDQDEKVNEVIDSFTPPFVVIFFVLSGAEVDFSNFKDTSILVALIILILTYVICRSFGKFFGVLAGGKLIKCDKKVSNLLSFGLMPQGGVAIGLSLLVTKLDALSQFSSIIASTIIIACFITELFGPLMTKYMIFKAGEANTNK